MVAAAVIGGVGALGAAGINAYSANQASKNQVAAQQAAIGEQQQMFNTVQSDLTPFMNAGSGAIPSLNTLLSSLTNFTSPSGGPLSAITNLSGLNGPQNMTAALQATPGYQFTQQMGQKAVNNSLAAQGLAGPGGPLATASANYATGLASNTWQSVLQAMLSAYQGGVSGLNTATGAVQNLVNTGADAAGGLANNATQTGSNIASNVSNIGNAQAAGTLGVGAAAAGGVNNLASYGMLASLLGGGSNGLYGPTGPTTSNNSTQIGALYAKGGRPPVGRPIIVGERGPERVDTDHGERVMVGRRGPELIMLRRPGTVIPNNRLHQLLHQNPRRGQGVRRLVKEKRRAR